MDSAKAGERCQERERLLFEWTECSNRVRKLKDERVATTKNVSTLLLPGRFDAFTERIRIAETAEVEACRAYYRHVNAHDCI